MLELSPDRGKERELKTRFGTVKEVYAAEWRGNYQSIFFEGLQNAVFWVVGQRLDDTSTCYEHTFRIREIEVIDHGAAYIPSQRLKVECEWTPYVGD